VDVRTLIRRSAIYYGDQEAVVFRNRRITFSEAWKRGVQLANGLLGFGLKPGDRVGVLVDNSVEAADSYVGMAAANLVRCPLYGRNKRETHAHMLGNTNCKAVMVSEEYLNELEGLKETLPDLERVFVTDESYEDWLASQSDVDPDVDVNPDDYFIIRHTGGTTGLPKGVAYTHRTWLNAVRDWFYNYPPVNPGDSILHLGPISHASGYMFLPVLAGGGCNVMMDKFEPDVTLDMMERERIAYIFIPPTALNILVQHPLVKGRDWSKLKVLNTGGSPISEDTIFKARHLFGDVLYQGYGQTEAVPATMMGPSEWFAEVKGSNPLRSCGRPLPFVDVEIWDDDDSPLPPGEEGVIMIRSDGQMTGFWNDPQETEKRMINGYVRTNDIGVIDHNGYIYLLDRKDDMIISGGYNIYPAELENVISKHPAVIETAVFGIPHEKWGETPMAVCVVNGNTPVTEDEIIDLVKENLGSYKKPTNVEITTDPLPKSMVGKVMRKTLRDPHWKGKDRRIGGA
jgi:acyl-CoA synthetase (AMP-forming)/AMP-acid ligase II